MRQYKLYTMCIALVICLVWVQLQKRHTLITNSPIHLRSHTHIHIYTRARVRAHVLTRSLTHISIQYCSYVMGGWVLHLHPTQGRVMEWEYTRNTKNYNKLIKLIQQQRPLNVLYVEMTQYHRVYSVPFCFIKLHINKHYTNLKIIEVLF